jgi:hypothetical protein
MTDPFRCSRCGSPWLVVRATYDLGQPARWEVTCGQGHRVVPVPGVEYTLKSEEI